jgi:hypothetical protein
MSEFGTTRTSRDVRYSVAIGGKADIEFSDGRTSTASGELGLFDSPFLRNSRSQGEIILLTNDM